MGGSAPSPERGELSPRQHAYIGLPFRAAPFQPLIPVGKIDASSKLAGVRAAGSERLTRLESRADSSDWSRPLLVIARRAGRHELIDRGAALTYYSILSLIPALLVIFSVIGLVGDQDTVNGVVSIVKEVGPDASEQTAREPLESLIHHDVQSGTLLGVGLIGVLWTASAYIGSFFRASATIWGVEKRRVVRAWPMRIALTVVFLLLLATALLLIVLTGKLAESIGNALGIGSGVLGVYDFLKWPALLLVVVLLVAILYRASPSGERSATRWRVLTPGGAVGVAVWLVVSAGFDVYANAFASYDSTYGALGTTIAALVWMWLTNLTLLLGVELDAALEFRSAADAEPVRGSN
jgi:membrane protein